MSRITSIVSAVLLTLLVASPVSAEQTQRRTPPSAETMVYDAFFMRPLSLLGTAVGAGVFLVTLPVSVVGGNVDEAAESLVAAPARNTFRRCLGCTTPHGTPGGM